MIIDELELLRTIYVDIDYGSFPQRDKCYNELLVVFDKIYEIMKVSHKDNYVEPRIGIHFGEVSACYSIQYANKEQIFETIALLKECISTMKENIETRHKKNKITVRGHQYNDNYLKYLDISPMGFKY